MPGLPPNTFGTWLAVVILVVTGMLAILHMIDTPVALVIASICALKL